MRYTTCMQSKDAIAARRPALAGKVLCGYQGWFRCPGDGVTPPGNWTHWMQGDKPPGKLLPATEMWPDLTEFGADEKYPFPGFTHDNGSPAYLFSSANGKTVRRHFDWMRTYGIDGVFVQRFLSQTGRTDFLSYAPVLPHVRRAARETGRVWCLEYDMSGGRDADLLERLARDWDTLTGRDSITSDPGYLYEKGKPVLALWGFFSERFSAATAHKILDYFLPRAYVVGGVNWPWRRDNADPEWSRAFRRFDAISPWNVGNASRDLLGTLRANTGPWQDDRREAEKSGMLFLPVVYPGFRWNNLKRLPPNTIGIPRRRGDFLREQFATAAEMGLTTVKVAMFDEVDEGTAILKVTNDPPTQFPYLTLEGLPSDAYLRIVGDETRKLHRRFAAR
jgi:hypothetical protein